MVDEASSGLDLALTLIVLATGVVFTFASIASINAETNSLSLYDKTAVRNYSGRVVEEYSYTTDELLLTLMIADMYEPKPSKLNIVNGGESKLLDLNPDASADSTYEGYNYVNSDRLTAIKSLWNSAGFSLQNAIGDGNDKVDLTTEEIGGDVSWFATITR